MKLATKWWANTLNEGFEDLALVSRSSLLTVFPDPREIAQEYGESPVGKANMRKFSAVGPRHLPIINRIRLALHLPLLISPDVREEEGLPTPITSPADWERAQAAQLTHVHAQFADVMTDLARSGAHTPSLWTADLVVVLELAYVTHVQPVMLGHFGRARSPKWTAAMHAYWNAVISGFSTTISAREGAIKQVMNHLRTRLDNRARAAQINSGAVASQAVEDDGELDPSKLDKEDRAIHEDLTSQLTSFRYAKNKMRLVALLREHGVRRNLPLPCPSFITDLKTTLEGFQHSVRWVSVVGSNFEIGTHC